MLVFPEAVGCAEVGLIIVVACETRGGGTTTLVFVLAGSTFSSAGAGAVKVGEEDAMEEEGGGVGADGENGVEMCAQRVAGIERHATGQGNDGNTEGLGSKGYAVGSLALECLLIDTALAGDN